MSADAVHNALLLRTQRLLLRYYDVALDLAVDEHVLTTLPPWAATAPMGQVDEVLLCRQAADGALEVGLFVSPAVLSRLAEQDPYRALREERLADFFLLVEGVSHFVHVAWAQQKGVPISAFDLELQAEVDKFCLATLLWQTQRQADAPRLYRLFDVLFERAHFDNAMGQAHRDRYRQASRIAARQVQRWLQAGVAMQPRALVRAARRWSRQGRPQKLAA